MNDIAYLISEERTKDDIGNDIVSHSEKLVFCEVSSASGQEFHKASQSGIKPQYRIKLWKYEYENQQLVRIGNDCFTVYRTFIDKETVELYLERRVGEQ